MCEQLPKYNRSTGRKINSAPLSKICVVLIRVFNPEADSPAG